MFIYFIFFYYMCISVWLVRESCLTSFLSFVLIILLYSKLCVFRCVHLFLMCLILIGRFLYFVNVMHVPGLKAPTN